MAAAVPPRRPAPDFASGETARETEIEREDDSVVECSLPRICQLWCGVAKRSAQAEARTRRHAPQIPGNTALPLFSLCLLFCYYLYLHFISAKFSLRANGAWLEHVQERLPAGSYLGCTIFIVEQYFS